MIFARVVAKPVNFPKELDIRYETLDRETGEDVAVFGAQRRFRGRRSGGSSLSAMRTLQGVRANYVEAKLLSLHRHRNGKVTGTPPIQHSESPAENLYATSIEAISRVPHQSPA
jgi:hypothetical protein